MLPVKYSNHFGAFKNNTLFYLIDNYFEQQEDSFINLVTFEKDDFAIYTKKPWNLITFEQNRSDQRTAGWKIHISATIDNHEEVFKIAANYCIENEIDFKFTADLEKFREINEKATPRVSHGKFIVLYPAEDTILTVLEDLYQKTKCFEGPYILTDKPYKDSKILFYRYGEFNPIRNISERGTIETFITDNENKLVQDMRVPYYRIPEWVEDLVVPQVNTEVQKESVFLSKYTPKEALQFSSSGGIYVVEDPEEKVWIAIESRQYSALDKKGMYAIERLERQKNFLTKLEKTGITPTVNDFILEHGNGYLIEERIEGISLREYTYLNNPLISLERDVSKIRKYYENILDILNQLLIKISVIHEHGIVIYDISDANVMLEKKEDGSFNVRIIDLEHSMYIDETKESEVYTMGYRSKEESKVKRDLDKVMLLGMVMIYPLNSLYELDETKKIALLEWAQENVPYLLDEYIEILLNHFTAQGLTDHQSKLSIKYEKADLIELTNSIYDLFDFSTKDKGYYIPADPHIFNTNPFSISHGIYGILFGIYQIHRNLDEPTPILLKERSMEIFEKEFASIKKLPTSLLMGSSGIVVYLLNLGLIKEAKSLYEEVSAQSVPILNDLFYGKAGLVITHLYYWMKTEDIEAKEKAREVADQLIAEDRLEYSGLYEGKAGVALSLLLTYTVTEEERYLDASETILKEVLDMLYINNIGNLTINRKKISSGETVESAFLYNGLSGVGMLLIQFYSITRNPEYKVLLDKIVKGLEHKIQYFPGLMRGLAGLTDFLISYYQLDENNSRVFDSIENKISSFKLFEVFNNSEDKSIGFPGEQLLKISHDLYTGSIGITSVLSRWVSYTNSEKKTSSTDIVLTIAEELINHQKQKVEILQ